jgi:hypothetical protein
VKVFDRLAHSAKEPFPVLIAVQSMSSNVR